MRKHRRLKRMGLGLVAVLLILAVTAAACGSESAPAAEGNTATATGGETSDPTATTDSTATPSGPVESPTPKVISDVPGEVGSLAPDLSGISGWINTQEFTLASLRGEVVLVDFWTYTCVNCLRTLPYLREWHEKYADLGLNIVGVHTPEFEFEKDFDNVVAAVKQHDLGWRMAQDNDFRTWRSYNNRYWPAKYLIDHEGVIRYRHFGEGRYDETEEQIRDLLMEIGADVSDIQANRDAGPDLDDGAYDEDGRVQQTRELYAGTDRNMGAQIPYYGNNEYFFADFNTSNEYEDPGQHRNHYLYLNGHWVNGSESIEHDRATENLEDYIALKFFGTSVNVVINSEGTEPYDVVITVDDKPVAQEAWGDDLRLNGEEMTVITVDEPRLYRLIRLPAYGSHELKLSSNSEDFNVYAFTFGSYATGF
jgi:thiol-disulfide isomerase/thioredoxin